MTKLQRLVALFFVFVLLGGPAVAQYEDATPILPGKLIMKIYRVNKEYHAAGEWHNAKFTRPWNKTPHSEADAFLNQHFALVQKWVEFNVILPYWIRKVQIDASGVSATGAPITNLETVDLGRRVITVMHEIQVAAAKLTPLIESPTFQEVWEEFIKRLDKLEQELQKLRK